MRGCEGEGEDTRLTAGWQAGSQLHHLEWILRFAQNDHSAAAVRS